MNTIDHTAMCIGKHTWMHFHSMLYLSMQHIVFLSSSSGIVSRLLQHTSYHQRVRQVECRESGEGFTNEVKLSACGEIPVRSS